MNNTEIKLLRDKLGLTQDAFAAKLGVSSGAVKKWEQAKARPSQLARRQLERLARRHGIK